VEMELDETVMVETEKVELEEAVVPS
jgi:hypothetical protein